MNGGVSNGYIWCSFERVHDVASESQIFDISTGNMWWILMAIGNQDGSGQCYRELGQVNLESQLAQT